jgi:hypothetical protein
MVWVVVEPVTKICPTVALTQLRSFESYSCVFEREAVHFTGRGNIGLPGYFSFFQPLDKS